MTNKIVLLSNQKYDEVFNLPVFKIDYLPITVDINNFDALIFTSKNAIYSLEQAKLNWKNKECFAISKKTAQVVKEVGGNLVFTGTASHGNEFALELIDKLKGKKVLYVKGEKVVSNLFEILKTKEINIKTCNSYKTVCNKEFENISFEQNSIFIFTSPSTVECFFKNYSWDESYKAVVIGKTTANYLPKNIEYYISDTQSIDSCIQLARNIIKN